jgi:hypothetical protein
VVVRSTKSRGLSFRHSETVVGSGPASRAFRASAPLPTLGRLEALVMECLWQSEAAVRVRDVALHLNGPWAYTTLMTTLDRLFEKNLLTRCVLETG